MVKDHSESERRNPLPPLQGLFCKISTLSRPNVNFRVRISVRFKFMARFRVEIRVKGRIRVRFRLVFLG